MRLSSRDRRSRSRPANTNATNASGGVTSVALNPAPRRNDAPAQCDGVVRTRMGRISAVMTFAAPAPGAPAAVGGPITAPVASPLTTSSIGLLCVST